MKTIVWLLSSVDLDLTILTCDSDSLSPCLAIVIISRIQEVWHRVVANNGMVNARKTYHSRTVYLLIPIVSLFTQCVALILIPESLFLPLFHTNVNVPYPSMDTTREIICQIEKGEGTFINRNWVQHTKVSNHKSHNGLCGRHNGQRKRLLLGLKRDS